MKKEVFINTINALRDQEEHDRAYTSKLRSIFGIEVEDYNHSWLQNAILSMLQNEYYPNGVHCLIEQFCFEFDFGRLFKKGDVVINSTEVDLSSPEALFNLLESLKVDATISTTQTAELITQIQKKANKQLQTN